MDNKRNELGDKMEETFQLIVQKMEKEKRKKRIRNFCVLVVIAAIGSYFLFTQVLGVCVVNGTSMGNSVPDQSVVVYNRRDKECREGDIVIAEHEGELIIKRVAGVKTGGYFLMGDNREESVDSRSFGLVKKEQIEGQVIIVLYTLF